MTRRVNVEQSQMVVVSFGSEYSDICLTTGGVSTCICLLAEGRLGDTNYLAMYHWEGFSAAFNDNPANANKEVDACIKRFAQNIFHKMNPYPMRLGTRPVLHTLSLIGGERAAKDLSGTEPEVEALDRQAETACTRYFTTSPHTTYIREHYLTSGTQCLRINLEKSGASWTFEQTYDSDLDEWYDSNHASDSEIDEKTEDMFRP